MSGSTRRNFLIASGAGAAAVGAAAALPAVAEAKTAGSATKPTLPSNAKSLVAHVSDPASGTIALLVGEHEVTVHDPDLVARLSHAAAAANQKEV